MLSRFYVLLLEHTNSARQKMTEFVWRTPLPTARYRYEHKFVHTKSCKIFVQNREINLLLAYILSIHDNKSYKIDQVDRLDMFWGVTKMTVVIPCYGITSFQAPLKPHRRGSLGNYVSTNLFINMVYVMIWWKHEYGGTCCCGSLKCLVSWYAKKHCLTCMIKNLPQSLMVMDRKWYFHLQPNEEQNILEEQKLQRNRRWER